MKNQYLTYQSLQPAKTPKLANNKTNQYRFWRKYLPVQIKPQSLINAESISIVNCIAANRNSKELMLFGHNRNITMIHTGTKSIVKQFNNFDNNVTSLALRADGALMALGDESGKIQVMDTSQKFRLRTFRNHKKRVNCIDFYEQDLYSGGDDMILRLFDVAGGSVIHSYDHAHDDYIRCVRGLQHNHVLSGSYDGKIKLFDFRVHQAPQNQFKHGAQVQCLDIMPSKLSFVVCGEKKMTLWDIRNSERPILQNSGFKKTISCVKVALDGSRILSSAYDSYFKVHKSDSFQVTYQEKMSSPILTFDISKNNFCIGFGLQDKKMLLKARVNKKTLENDQEEEKSQNQLEVEDQIALWLKNNEKNNKIALNDKYFYRGIYQKPQSYQIKFERNQNKKISEYDKLLKKFQYKKALFLAVEKKNMSVFIALIDEYVQRGCLDRTVKSMTCSEIQQIIPFLYYLVPDIRYSKMSLILLQKIVCKHFHESSESGKNILIFNKLKQFAQREIATLNQMKQLNGMLELVQKNCL